MKEFVTSSEEHVLNSNQRNLFSVAYKNIVGKHRNSWRMVCSVQSKESSSVAEDYKKVIKSELEETCREVIVCCLVKFYGYEACIRMFHVGTA